MRRLFCLLGLLASCYSPDAMDGLPCSESHNCPSGQMCDLETNTCSATAPPKMVLYAISAGADHTCGVDQQGALYCWGHNDYGQLGVGDSDDRSTPTRVGDASNWGSISAGEKATCGIRDGTLWCWGDSRTLGTQSNKPTQITVPQKSWQSISVGYQGFCAVTTEKTLWCRWFGEDALTERTEAPVPVESVSASNGHQCTLDAQHQLYCWGTNNTGQVGNGDNSGNMDVTVPFHHDGEWDDVTAPAWHTCALKHGGELWCWGDCGRGAVQDTPPPDSGYCDTPQRVTMNAYVVIAAGWDHTCAITDVHNVVCLGNNEAGDLGTATIDPIEIPSTVYGTQDWATVAAGTEHTCGTTQDGTAWCWGSNRYGQLGVGETAHAQTPQQLDVHRPVLDVSAGDTTSCAIGADHSLSCWGNNGAGQIGDGTTNQSLEPYEFNSENRDWQAVSVGTNHTCGIRSPGALYCWGSNRQGQLGLNNTSDETERAPKQVGSATDWTSVVAGTQETCGTRANGLYCWGDRSREIAPHLLDSGAGWIQLAAHASPDVFEKGAHAISGGATWDLYDIASPPVANNHNIPALTTATPFALTQGFDHGCELVTGGGLFCWGYNDVGQLGIDAYPMTNQDSIGGPPGAWIAVSAGGYTTCAIAEGTEEIYCFGSDTLLGVPTANERNFTPTPLQPGTAWSKVSVGHRHACAIKKADGTLWCWGDNLLGELGLGPPGALHPRRVHPAM